MSEDTPVSNVVALPNCFVPNNEPVKEVIDILEEFLAKARDGRIVALGLIVVEREPMAFELVYTARQGSRHTLIAGAAALSVKLAAQAAGIID